MNSHPLNGKAAKVIRAKLRETYPVLEEEHFELLWPKNAPVLQLKIKG